MRWGAAFGPRFDGGGAHTAHARLRGSILPATWRRPPLAASSEAGFGEGLLAGVDEGRRPAEVAGSNAGGPLVVAAVYSLYAAQHSAVLLPAPPRARMAAAVNRPRLAGSW